MNRRDVLMGLAGVGGLFGLNFGGRVSGPESTRPADRDSEIEDEIGRYADAAARVVENQDWQTPKAISAPFSATPLNHYVTEPDHRLVEPPDELAPLVDQLKRRDPRALGKMAFIACRLWERWRPRDDGWEQVAWESDFRSSVAGKPVRADRVCSVKYLVDTTELTNWRLARIFVGVRDIVRELESNLDRAVECVLTSDQADDVSGRDHPRVGPPDEARHRVRCFAQYRPLEADIRLDAFMLQSFFWVEAAGVVLREEES